MSFGQFNIFQPSTQTNQTQCSVNLAVEDIVEKDNGIPEMVTFELNYRITNRCKSCFGKYTKILEQEGQILQKNTQSLNTAYGPHTLTIDIDTNNLFNGIYSLKIIFMAVDAVCKKPANIERSIDFTVGRQLSIIYLSGDQLFNYKFFPKEILDTLPGYQKWKSKVQLDFLNHQINGSPCSPSRATMYTGLHSSTAKVSDNTNVTYQPEMPAINQGGVDIYNTPLETIGTLLPNYNKRYIGKFHIDDDLNYKNVNKPVPTWNTSKALDKYGLGEYNLYGDPCYYPHAAFWNDYRSTETRLPDGTRGDYKDKSGSYSGAIPFMRANVNSAQPWLLMINYEGTHDIMYYWANSDQDILVSCLQANQYPKNSPEYKDRQDKLGNSVDEISDIFSQRDFNANSSIYNNDVSSKFPDGLLFSNSFSQDFVGEPISNTNTLDAYLIYNLGVDYLFTNISSDNIGAWKAYQQMYFNVTRQMDREFERIYDEIEQLKLWNKVAVIITADHGEMCGAHGLRNKLNTPYKETMNVPLMIYSPNLISTGEVTQITSHINIVPTLLTIAGADIPLNMGNSLLEYNEMGRLKIASLQDKSLFVCTGFMSYLGYFVSKVLPEVSQTTYPVPNPKDAMIQRVNNVNSKLFSDNILTYPGMVSSIVIKYNGDYYKFNRFYSLDAILIDTVQLLIDYNLLSVIFDSGIFSPIQQAAILAYPTTNLLASNTKLDLLIEITKLLNGWFANPGIDKGFDVLIQPNNAGIINYQFQCFNMTDDPDEIINLADSSRVMTHSLLLQELNAELDNIIKQEETDRMYIALPSDRLVTFNITGNSMGSTMLNFWLTDIDPTDDTRQFVFNGYTGPFQDGTIIKIPPLL